MCNTSFFHYKPPAHTNTTFHLHGVSAKAIFQLHGNSRQVLSRQIYYKSQVEDVNRCYQHRDEIRIKLIGITYPELSPGTA